jgi:hypothetical protein
MFRRVRLPTVASCLVLAVALTGCPPDPQGGLLTCTTDAEKRFVVGATQEWYLYPDLLPALDQATYDASSPAELLDFLTAGARAAGQDRGWSYLADLQATLGYYQGDPSVGFGMSLEIRGTQLFVTQVVAGSAAAGQGFLRGDEISAIGTPGEAMVDAATLISGGTLGTALGPSVADVTREFDVLPVTGGGTVHRSVSKASYVLHPVPFYAVSGSTGYVNLRTFTVPAEGELDEAFAAFSAADPPVTSVIVDLRYNGGGLVSVAEHLADLLGGAFPGAIMHGWRVNEFHMSDPDLPEPTRFSQLPASVAPVKIAFITTGATASASELVANVLEPWATVALVGDRTYGKPVGQFQFQLPGCNLLLALVSFQLPNADGEAEYFGGLPDPPAFSGPLCAAPDDLTHAMGDPAEASTQAALAWIADGTCPAPAAAVAQPGAAYVLTGGRHAPVTAPAPTPAQRDNPGLF